MLGGLGQAGHRGAGRQSTMPTTIDQGGREVSSFTSASVKQGTVPAADDTLGPLVNEKAHPVWDGWA